MRILIGYDGSESADVALRDLPHAGLPSEAEALIVTVADVMMTAEPLSYELVGPALVSGRASGIMFAQAQTLRAMKEAENFASHASDQVRTFFPGWKVRAEAVSGDPATELIRKADKWRADLVVVGSQGRSAVGRLLLGSVSKKLVTNLKSSVRVVRGLSQSEADVAPKILIGVDGSPGAERAVRSVGSRVWPADTEIRVVAVDDGTSPTSISAILPTTTEMITACNEESAVAARTMVEWAENELNAIGLKTSVIFRHGDAQRVLLDEARKFEADSIFVGSRQFSSAFERFSLGSVSTGLVTKASSAVEVVR